MKKLLSVLLFIGMALMFGCIPQDAPPQLTLDQYQLTMSAGAHAAITVTGGSGVYGAASSCDAFVQVRVEGSRIFLAMKSVGKATVIVMDQKSFQTALCEVNVTSPIPDLAIAPASLALVAGATGEITITAGSGQYEVASDMPGVAEATLSGTSVTVRGVSVGNATVTVTDTTSNQTQTCEVRVTAPVSDYGIEMVYVAGGSFAMGSTTGERDERPVHTVNMSAYYIGRTEVTQGQWKAVMGASNNPSHFTGDDNLPVETVSWDDAQAFINKLNELTGKAYRLPTEAEWEYAARGGMQTHNYLYAGSDTIDDVAWYNGNSSNKTHPVAQQAPNELGLYDMSGNVYEWCSDWYGSYGAEEQTNPTGPAKGSYRVLRGGSWGASAILCRSAFRLNARPANRFNYYGLRVLASQL